MNEAEKNKLKNLTDTAPYSTSWYVSSYDVFIASLNMYTSLLKNISDAGTKQINTEIEYTQRVINRLLEARNSDGVSMKRMTVDGETYKLLNSAINKYRALLNQIYVRKKQTALAPEQLESEEEQLENIRKVLDNEVFQNVPRRKLIIEDFSTAYFADADIDKKLVKNIPIKRSEKKPSGSLRLVKSTTGRKYIVKANVKHYIPDSETKNALGLEGGAFVQLTDKRLGELEDGENIQSVKSPSTRLVRTKKNHDAVFMVFTWPDSHRRHVPDEATLAAMLRRQDQVEIIGDEEMKSIPEKEPINPSSKWDPKITKSEQQSVQHINNYYGPIGTSVGTNTGKIRNKQKTHIKNFTNQTDDHIWLQWIMEIIAGLIVLLVGAYIFGIGR
ncbi:MAG: hypothetical protein AAB649_04315 [Patescibacteria group bacterium]